MSTKIRNSISMYTNSTQSYIDTLPPLANKVLLGSSQLVLIFFRNIIGINSPEHHTRITIGPVNFFFPEMRNSSIQ